MIAVTDEGLLTSVVLAHVATRQRTLNRFSGYRAGLGKRQGLDHRDELPLAAAFALLHVMRKDRLCAWVQLPSLVVVCAGGAGTAFDPNSELPL